MKCILIYMFIIAISCCLCDAQLWANDENDEGIKFAEDVAPLGSLPKDFENMKERVGEKVGERVDKLNNWWEQKKDSLSKFVHRPFEKYQLEKEEEEHEKNRLEYMQGKEDALESKRQANIKGAKDANNKIGEINRQNTNCLSKWTYSERKSCIDALKNDEFVRRLPRIKENIDDERVTLGLEPVDWNNVNISELKDRDGCIVAAENYEKAAQLKNGDNAIQQYEWLQQNCGDDLKKLVDKEGLKYPTRKNGAAANALFKSALDGKLKTAPVANSNNNGWNLGEILEFGLKLGAVISQFQEIRSSVAPAGGGTVAGQSKTLNSTFPCPQGGASGGAGVYCMPDVKLPSR